MRAVNSAGTSPDAGIPPAFATHTSQKRNRNLQKILNNGPILVYEYQFFLKFIYLTSLYTEYGT